MKEDSKKTIRKLQLLAEVLPQWMISQGSDQDIVLLTRSSLHRNSEEFFFPHNILASDLPVFLSRCHAAAKELFPNLHCYANLKLHSNILIEQQYIDNNYRGQEVYLSEEKNSALVINDEDHFTILTIAAGNNILSNIKKLQVLDKTLEKHFNYAISINWGYLRSHCMKLGAGLHTDVYLHLPAFSKQESFMQYTESLKKNSYTIYSFGNKRYPLGDLYRLSIDSPLGYNEEQCSYALDLVVKEIIHAERNERQNLLRKSGLRFRDTLWRDLGILSHARDIETREAFTRFSNIRLGGELRVLPPNASPLLFFLNQRHLIRFAHSILYEDRNAYSAQRRENEMRADIFRKLLNTDS